MKPLTTILATAVLIPTLSMPSYAGRRRHRVYQEPPRPSTQQYEQRQLPRAPKNNNSPSHQSLRPLKTSDFSPYKPVKPPKKVGGSKPQRKMSANERALRNAGSLGGAIKGAASPSNIATGVAGGIVEGIFSIFFGSSKSSKSTK